MHRIDKCSCTLDVVVLNDFNWRCTIFLLHGLSGGSTLDSLDREDDILMNFAVHGELAGLTEGARAPCEVALERLLLRVYVGVLLQILGQCERLEAQNANVLLDRRV